MYWLLRLISNNPKHPIVRKTSDICSSGTLGNLIFIRQKGGEFLNFKVTMRLFVETAAHCPQKTDGHLVVV